MVRVAEVIRSWLGWCPCAGRETMRKNIGDGFYQAVPVMKRQVPRGADGPAGFMAGVYEHTQRGSVIIGAALAAILIILASMYLFGAVWVTALVLCIMLGLLAICSTLTVTVQDGSVQIRFGPVPLIRNAWLLSDIVSATPVTTPWYYGYGIRYTPHGILYNVSGPHSVELLLVSGKKVRIGTDEPAALCSAIQAARATTGTGWQG